MWFNSLATGQLEKYQIIIELLKIRTWTTNKTFLWINIKYIYIDIFFNKIKWTNTL